MTRSTLSMMDHTAILIKYLRNDDGEILVCRLIRLEFTSSPSSLLSHHADAREVCTVWQSFLRDESLLRPFLIVREHHRNSPA